jgi:hypothetical protein
VVAEVEAAVVATVRVAEADARKIGMMMVMTTMMVGINLSTNNLLLIILHPHLINKHRLLLNMLRLHRRPNSLLLPHEVLVGV